jgi:hypothetical protein
MAGKIIAGYFFVAKIPGFSSFIFIKYMDYRPIIGSFLFKTYYVKRTTYHLTIQQFIKLCTNVCYTK